MDRRIALVTTNLAWAGAEVQVFHLATRLKGCGWEAAVVSLVPPTALVGELEAHSIPVITLEMRGMCSALRACVDLARFLNRFRPDVVHAHMFHANLLSRLVRLLSPVPALVCTAHSTYEASSGTARPRELTWREWAYRLTDPLCDVTTQVSQAGLERYVRVKAVPKGRIRLVPNAVDTERFRPDSEARVRGRASLGLRNEFAWLTVGRFDAVKDHWTLLQAFARLGHARTVLLLVGVGRLRAKAEELAGSLGIADRVRFLGFRGDVPDLMNAADGYVMASRWEGLPMALLEAQACGLPVVATRVGGVEEVVRHGETGLLVPPGDHAALSSAMEQVMTTPAEDRRRTGESARFWIENHFSLSRVVDQWEALYREVLTRNGGTRRRTGGDRRNKG